MRPTVPRTFVFLLAALLLGGLLMLANAPVSRAQGAGYMISAWGYNGDGQCNVPAPNSRFKAVSGGGSTAWT